MKPAINRQNSCSFSGYRPEKLPWGLQEEDERCTVLKEKLQDVIAAVYSSGVRHFLCGMALGSDTLFCEAVLLFRDEHPEVTLEAALPCENQASKWNERQRYRYYQLLEQCDTQTYVSRKYSPDCMMKRNMYMVNQSSVLIAVYDGRPGGTMHTVHFAERNGLEIIQIRP